nr:hypothetical protein [Umezawaea beigongshangensis]
MTASLLVEWAARPAVRVSVLAVVAGVIRSRGERHRGAGTIPVLCRKSPKCVIDHPLVGELVLDCDVLTVPGADLRLVTCTTTAGGNGRRQARPAESHRWPQHRREGTVTSGVPCPVARERLRRGCPRTPATVRCRRAWPGTTAPPSSRLSTARGCCVPLRPAARRRAGARDLTAPPGSTADRGVRRSAEPEDATAAVLAAEVADDPVHRCGGW